MTQDIPEFEVSDYSRRIVIRAAASATSLGLLGTSVGTVRGQEELNVKDFGAKGDGETVDTAAFQAAMDEAVDGGTVYVPPGEYPVRRVRVRRNTTVYGEGRDSKVLHAPHDLDATPNTNIFRTSYSDDVTIRDLWFRGNLAAHTYTGEPGNFYSDMINFKGGQRVRLERCFFDDVLSGDVVDLDDTEACRNHSILDNHIDMTAHGGTDEGIQMRGHNHLIKGNYVIGSDGRRRAAICVDDGSTNNTFNENVVEDSYRAYDIRGDPNNPSHPFSQNEAIGTFQSESNLDGAILTPSNDLDDEVPVAISTLEPTNIGVSSALLNGELVDLGSNDSVICYFQWRKVDTSEWNSTDPMTLNEPGTFHESISGLESNTEYEYLAVAEAADTQTTGVAYFFVTDTDSGSSTPKTVTFQQGVDGYSGTVDTYLQEAEPDANNASAATLLVDASNPGKTNQSVQALLRFDSIVGSDSSQIPSGSSVTEATLTIETTNGGHGGKFHPMLIDWSDTDTWNTLDGGVQADDSEAASSSDVTTGSVSVGSVSFDVSQRVQAWVNGESNNGWAILPSGRNGWRFDSAEGSVKPKLTVTYE